MSEALLIIRQIIIGMALLGVLAAEITVVMTRLLSKTVGLAALHTSENCPGYALGITGPSSAAMA
jgi:hypothetical protein